MRRALERNCSAAIRDGCARSRLKPGFSAKVVRRCGLRRTLTLGCEHTHSTKSTAGATGRLRTVCAISKNAPNESLKPTAARRNTQIKLYQTIVCDRPAHSSHQLFR